MQVDAPATAFGLVPGGGATTYRGPSSATVYLASLAAVVFRSNPNLTAAQVRDVLVSSAAWESGTGFAPTLDANAAIDIANKSTEFEFEVVDDRLLIRTSRFDDEVRFDLGRSEIWINGIKYGIETGYSQLSVHGKAGYDSISFGDTMQDDVAFAVSNFAQFTSPSQIAIGMDFENVQFRAANGQDGFWTSGTNSDEFVTMDGAAVSLAGPGYFREWIGFDEVRIVGGGGTDRANLIGSSIEENFFSAPNLVRLTHSELFSQFVGFDFVTAEMGVGPDTAIVLGGSSNDSILLAPRTRPTSWYRIRLSGIGFRNHYELWRSR